VIADRHPDLPASDSDVPAAFGREACGLFIVRGGTYDLDDFVEARGHPHAPFALSQAQAAPLPNADGGNNPIGGGIDAWGRTVNMVGDLHCSLDAGDAGRRVTCGDLSQGAADGRIDARHAAGQMIGNPDG
jgi:hypothetical protein